MKAPVTLAAVILYGLGGVYSGHAHSQDLNSALDNIEISSDAQDAVKKGTGGAQPCAITKGVTCTSSYDDTNDVNDNNVHQASALQSAISGNDIPAATINGVSVGAVGNQGAGPIGGAGQIGSTPQIGGF